MNTLHWQREKSLNANDIRIGSSLVEVMASISVGAVLTGIVVTSMAALFRYDRQIAEQNTDRDHLQMLVGQLRDDIRKATECSFAPGDVVLTFVHANKEQVTYRSHDSHVDRTTLSAQSTETARFRVPPSLHITSAPEDVKAGQLIRIHLTTHANEDKQAETQLKPDWDLQIEGTVGRDLPIANEDVLNR